jgi:hypothetical protein
LAGDYLRTPSRPRTFGYIDQDVREVWRTLFATQDLQAYLQRLSTTIRNARPGLHDQLTDLLRETALLSALARNDDQTGHHHALIMVHYLQPSIYALGMPLKIAHFELLAGQLGMEIESPEPDDLSRLDHWFVIRGWRSVALARAEEGTHLLIHGDRLEPVSVKVSSLDPQADVEATIRNHHAGFGRGPAAQGESDAAVMDLEEMKFDPVVRVHHLHSGLTLDLRSGLMITNHRSPESLRALLLSALPLADELTE